MESYDSKIINKGNAIGAAYVGALLMEAFDVQTPVYLPWFFENKKVALPFLDVEVEEELEYENAPVRYGQKAVGAFYFKGGRYMTYDYTGKLIESEYSDLLMPLATMVDLDRPKVTKKTGTSFGTVKEICGLDDWVISINGIILPDKYNPEGQQTVAEQMDAIQKFHEIAGSIEVEGQLFADRYITRLVTESLSFKPVQGHPNMMQFSIEAVSDIDTLLTDIL